MDEKTKKKWKWTLNLAVTVVITVFVALYFGLPLLQKQLKQVQTEYQKATEDVEKSVGFWSTQNEQFRNRMAQDFEDRQKFYSNIVTRESRDLTNAAVVVDQVFLAQETYRLSEDAFKEALNTFDAYMQTRTGAGDFHLLKPGTFIRSLDEADNDYGDSLKKWVDLLIKLDQTGFMSQRQNTTLARLGEARMFVIINAKLTYLHDVTQQGAERIQLCRDIESLLCQYENYFINMSQAFTADDFADLPGFLKRLRKRQDDTAAANLYANLSIESQKMLSTFEGAATNFDKLGAALAADLQRIISGPAINSTYKSFGFESNPGERRGADHGLVFTNAGIALSNRMQLENDFPREIVRKRDLSAAASLFPPEAYPPGKKPDELRQYEIKKCQCYLDYLRAKYYYRSHRYDDALAMAQEAAKKDPDQIQKSRRMYYPDQYLQIVILEAKLWDNIKEGTYTNDGIVGQIRNVQKELEEYYKLFPDMKDATYLAVQQSLLEWSAYDGRERREPWSDQEAHYARFTAYYGKMIPQDQAFYNFIKIDTEGDYNCLESINWGYQTNVFKKMKKTDEYVQAADIIADLCLARKDTSTNSFQHIDEADELLKTGTYQKGLPAGILLRLQKDIKILKEHKGDTNLWSDFDKSER